MTDTVEDTQDGEVSGNPLADERLQFFLRHRDTIREWAAIEREVQEATHEILAGLVPLASDRIASLDPSAIVQLDGLGGGWIRLAIRRESWPCRGNGHAVVALTLEWTPRVDPFGSALPYMGIRVDQSVPEGPPIRQRLGPIVAASAAPLQAAGYKVTAGGWWAVGQSLPKSRTWWHELDVWRAGIIERLAKTWPIVSPLVEDALR